MVFKIHMHTQSLLLVLFPLSFLYKEKLFFCFFNFVSMWDDRCSLKSLWSSFHGICKLNHYAIRLKTSSVLYANYISIKLGGGNILILKLQNNILEKIQRKKSRCHLISQREESKQCCFGSTYLCGKGFNISES